MKILFLTLMKIDSLSDEGIYMDLMQEFRKNGHEVVIVSPLEKKYGFETEILREEGLSLLRCKTGNLFGVGMFEKGISQMLLPFFYQKEIKRAFPSLSFDLILYSTPPISLAGVVKKLKRKTGAKTYLLLKDIFPQNAVDIGILSPLMAKILFRREERKLYQISDFIGCMSQANVDYLLSHNKGLEEKVGICPNSIALREKKKGNREEISKKYGFSKEKLLFLYGGNLGKPQGLPFLIRCVEKMKEEKEIHFIICGKGSEYGVLEAYREEKKPENLTLIPGLPKEEYDELVSISDVGMIFLDYRFTIPNFPSRLLSYMEAGIPTLVCTDENSDMGKIATENRFGLFAPSNSVEKFQETARLFLDKGLREEYGRRARTYLEENYTVEKSYLEIVGKISSREPRES